MAYTSLAPLVFLREAKPPLMTLILHLFECGVSLEGNGGGEGNASIRKGLFDVFLLAKHFLKKPL